MNFDFYAGMEDKVAILDYIFEQTSLEIFDLYSEYGQEISQYKHTNEIANKFDLQNDRQTFQLWSRNFGGEVQFSKVALDPKYCNGHTFRFSTGGWGLIQLYFEGLKNGILGYSHIGHFNEKGALKWADSELVKDNVRSWNWSNIRQTSRKLTYNIDRMAVRKIGSWRILPGADRLSHNKIRLGGS